MKQSLVQFRVGARLHHELRETAERKSMTVSELIRAAVRRQLEEA